MSNLDYIELFITALQKNSDNPKWKEGAFIGIKTVSNTKVGSIGHISNVVNKKRRQ